MVKLSETLLKKSVKGKNLKTVKKIELVKLEIDAMSSVLGIVERL